LFNVGFHSNGGEDIIQNLIGRLVFSQSGRDRGKAFVVVGVLQDRYILIADGDVHKIEKPKKKNIRHVKVSNIVADKVYEYLDRGEKPDNYLIKKNIQSILENEESTGKEV